MAERNIRNTLLKNLFVAPRPRDRNAYFNSKRQFFPYEESFVAFLRTDSHEEMLDHARNILNSLAYSTEFSPPTSLLSNLLADQEQQHMVAREGDYVPRDHYVHLVHLYLLGIYLFLYHDSLHNHIVDSVTQLRRELQITTQRRSNDLSAYDLFGIAWKQFVLLHDVGYPLERLEPKLRDQDPYKAQIYPYSRLVEGYFADLAGKALSRLITASAILKEDSHITLADNFGEEFDLEEIQQETKEVTAIEKKDTWKRWSSATAVPRVNGPQDVSVLLACLAEPQIIAVLQDLGGGELKAAVVLDAGSLRLFKDKSFRSDTSQLRTTFGASSSPESRFIRMIQPHAGARWRFYLKDGNSAFEKVLDSVFGQNKKDFHFISSEIFDDYHLRAIETEGVDNADSVSSIVFARLLASIQYRPLKSRGEDLRYETESHLRARKDSTKKTLLKLPKLVGDAVANYLSNSVRDDSTEILKDLGNTGGYQIAEKLYNKLVAKGERDAILKEIRGRVTRTLGAPLQLQSKVRELIITLGEKLAQNASVDSKGLEFIKDGAKMSKIQLKDLISRGNSEGLDQELSHRKLKGLEYLGEHYSPAWTRGDPAWPSGSYCDHGLTASALGLIIMQLDEVFRNSLAKKTAFLRIASFGIEHNLREHQIHRILFVRWSLFAAAVHNLYPSELQDTREKGFIGPAYRTRMTDHSFAYLALLADGLQKWDRAMLLDKSRSAMGTVVPGTRFNLSISKNQLHVSLTGPRHRSDEVFKLRDMLSQYLKDADSLISTSYTEMS